MCILLQNIPGWAQSVAVESVDNTVQVNNETLIIPLIKEADENIALYLVITPRSAANLNGIRFQLDAKAVRDIAVLHIFTTDTVPGFVKAKLLKAVKPSRKKPWVSLSQTLTPSVKNHFWISVVLKKTANIDDQITVKASQILVTGGKRIPVESRAGTPAKRLGLVLRKAGQDGVNTYRIPGITVTDKGTLIAVYDIRHNSSRDLPGNIDIGMSRSTNAGHSWQPMQTIIDMGKPDAENGVGDPCILFDPITRKIWVAALWSKGNHAIAGSRPGLSPDESGQLVLTSSSDDGQTWSDPVNITAQVKNPAWRILFQGPGSGITTGDGTLVFPAQYWDAAGIPYATIIYSKDHGQTWKTGTGAKSNTTESQVVEIAPGSLMLNMRDNRGAFRSIAVTNDWGKTWIEHPSSRKALADPVCEAAFIGIQVNGNPEPVLLFSNPDSPKKRDSMTIKASLDAGYSWPLNQQLLVDARNGFGYSSLVRIDEKYIGILYEGVRDLYFLRIPLSDILRTQ